MPYNTKAVANYLLKKSWDAGRILTPMQLLKLVYIAHGWHLGYTNEPLIDDEVEAWTYGPVVPSLYHSLKKYGGGAITQPLEEGWLQQPVRTEEISPSSRALLDEVSRVYAPYSGVQLSTMTHKEGTPWHAIWVGQNGHLSRGAVIPNELIRSHYAQMINVAQPPQQEAAYGTAG